MNDSKQHGSEEVFVFPTTAAQRRFWLLDELKPGNPALNVPLAARLTGKLDAALLERAVNEVLRRHEVLRTSFQTLERDVVQVIHPSRALKLDQYDITSLPEAQREDEVHRLMIEEGERSFVLAEGPLLRGGLIKVRSEEHVMMLTMHHIACDGWSNGIVMREVAEIYTAMIEGREVPELPLQYADFAQWQTDWLETPAAEEQRAYWKQRLSGVLPVMNLPTDRPRKAGRHYPGTIETLLLPRELTDSLKDLCTREDATLFMLFLATYATLLYRYTGNPDIVIGSPAANRGQTELEGLIGLFANPLVLRMDLRGNPAFQDLLERVRELSLSSFSQQGYPFEKLFEELRTNPTRAGVQWLQVYFVFQRAFMLPQQMPELRLTPLRSVSPGAMFEWTLGVLERTEGIRLQLEYNTDLYERSTIERMLGHFEKVLVHVVQQGLGTSLDELPILTETEYRGLVVERNQRKTAVPRERRIQELIEDRARLTPNAPALIAENALTFEALNRRANQWAHFLRRSGVGPESRVGVLMESHAPERLIAVLAILKAGGCFVLLDPSGNADQILQRNKDLALTLALSSLPQAGSWAAGGLRVIETRSIPEAAESAENLSNIVLSEQPACIQFGRGRSSGGQGSILSHRALLGGAVGFAEECGLGPSDRVSGGMVEMLAGLTSGAAVVMPCAVRSSREWIAWLDRNQVTVSCVSTHFWHDVVRNLSSDGGRALISLRVVVVSGETLSPVAWEAWSHWNSGRIRSLVRYDLAEVAGGAAVHEPRPGDASSVRTSIGRCTANTRIYLLDSHCQPLPIGVVGDVWVGGESLTSGRLVGGVPTTAELLADKFAGKLDARMIRTGDRGRFLTDGTIELVGRSEQLAATPDFRLELCEVRALLFQNPAVWDAILIVRAGNEGSAVVAYVIPRTGMTLTGLEAREYLRQRVPEYMVPAAVVIVPGFTLDAKGHLDVGALPEPRREKPRVIHPTTPAETRLTQIWERVLGIKPIGITDNFFDIGGHSLSALALFRAIRKEWGRNLPLVTLFEAPTIEKLARILVADDAKAPWQSLVPLKTDGTRPAFYCVHGVGGNILEFHDLARRAAPDQPLYGLQAQGLDGKAPHTSVAAMASHYIKEIREFQPEGPYYLGGSSFGGLVAYEIAQQLRAAGQEVGVLILFDTWAPGYPVRLTTKTGWKRRVDWWRDRFDLHWGNLRVASTRGRVDYFKTKAIRVFQRIIKPWHKLWRDTRSRFQPTAIRRVRSVGHQALRSYKPQPYAGRVTLFRATVQPRGVQEDRTNGWNRFAEGGVDVYDVDGHHGAIIREPRVAQLAAKLMVCLRNAQESQNSTEDGAVKDVPGGRHGAAERLGGAKVPSPHRPACVELSSTPPRSSNPERWEPISSKGEGQFSE